MTPRLRRPLVPAGHGPVAGPTTDLAGQISKLQAYAPGGGDAVFFGTNDSGSFPAAMVLRGILAVGATAGSITLQWAQVTSSASGVTVNKKSYIKLLRVA